jgi:hypothetical protein
MNKTSPKVLKEITAEVVRAYADCNMEWEEGAKLRNLDFKASGPVNRDEAVDIMALALNRDGSYNDFTPDVLSLLPEDAEVWLAREGSVAVYVRSNSTKQWLHKMNADEADIVGDDEEYYRMWWD